MPSVLCLFRFSGYVQDGQAVKQQCGGDQNQHTGEGSHCGFPEADGMAHHQFEGIQRFNRSAFE